MLIHATNLYTRTVQQVYYYINCIINSKQTITIPYTVAGISVTVSNIMGPCGCGHLALIGLGPSHYTILYIIMMMV